MMSVIPKSGFSDHSNPQKSLSVFRRYSNPKAHMAWWLSEWSVACSDEVVSSDASNPVKACKAFLLSLYRAYAPGCTFWRHVFVRCTH